MALANEIIRMLSRKAGFDVDTPSGANRLSLVMDLKSETRLGRNTICRLTGVLPSSTTPRRSTLDAIAKYLDYKNWVAFLEANPALKDACYASDPKFSKTYSSCLESIKPSRYAFTMQCDRIPDSEGWDLSRWSTWIDYSFRLSV